MERAKQKRAADTAVLAYLESESGNAVRASASMFAEASSWAMRLGVPPTVLMDTLYREMVKLHEMGLAGE